MELPRSETVALLVCLGLWDAAPDGTSRLEPIDKRTNIDVIGGM